MPAKPRIRKRAGVAREERAGRQEDEEADRAQDRVRDDHLLERLQRRADRPTRARDAAPLVERGGEVERERAGAVRGVLRQRRVLCAVVGVRRPVRPDDRLRRA